MPNITIPEEHLGNPVGYAGANFAVEQIGAMYKLSTAMYRHSKVPLREFEAARAIIAKINGCRMCQQFRSLDDVPAYFDGLGMDAEKGVHRNGPPTDEALYLEIDNWRTSPVYTDRERLAIEYAERFSLEPDAVAYDAAFWERMHEKFTDDEIMELTVAISIFVATGRFVHVLGFDSAQACDIRHEQMAAE